MGWASRPARVCGQAAWPGNVAKRTPFGIHEFSAARTARCSRHPSRRNKESHGEMRESTLSLRQRILSVGRRTTIEMRIGRLIRIGLALGAAVPALAVEGGIGRTRPG